MARHFAWTTDCAPKMAENAAYDALGLYRGVERTFLRAETPLSILDRLTSDGAADLADVLPKWKPWLPPRQSQGLQQGGTLVFCGEEELLRHYDEATGAHASLEDVAVAAAGK